MVKIIVLAICLLIPSFSWAAWLNDKAPDFTLPDRSRKSVSLKDLKGKVIYINFWASWCAPCKKELPELNELAYKYKDAEFIILAVNIDKMKANADEFLSKIPHIARNMILVFDTQASVVQSYGTRAMPASFIVDKEGVIRYTHLGFNESDTEKWVTEVEPLLK